MCKYVHVYEASEVQAWLNCQSKAQIQGGAGQTILVPDTTTQHHLVWPQPSKSLRILNCGHTYMYCTNQMPIALTYLTLITTLVLLYPTLAYSIFLYSCYRCLLPVTLPRYPCSLVTLPIPPCTVWCIQTLCVYMLFTSQIQLCRY